MTVGPEDPWLKDALRPPFRCVLGAPWRQANFKFADQSGSWPGSTLSQVDPCLNAWVDI